VSEYHTIKWDDVNTYLENLRESSLGSIEQENQDSWRGLDWELGNYDRAKPRKWSKVVKIEVS
jgi:hypothetical protein